MIAGHYPRNKATETSTCDHCKEAAARACEPFECWVCGRYDRCMAAGMTPDHSVLANNCMLCRNTIAPESYKHDVTPQLAPGSPVYDQEVDDEALWAADRSPRYRSPSPGYQYPI